MKKTKKIAIGMAVAMSLLLALALTAYAHSGRTDSQGGHKDNNNVSGLGPYHYHCGGNPPHLHPNGVCPYSSGSSSSTQPTTQPTTQAPARPATTQPPAPAQPATQAPTPIPAPQPPKPPSVGDPIGNVVYTDITAYINGQPIPISNINGYAHIVVEDLQHYGFDVVWNGKDNTLKVERNKGKAMQPLPAEKIPAGKRPGDVRAKYVLSAIKVYLSGELVESYSINGYMFIDFELLKKYGTVTWDKAARKLSCRLD